MKAIKNIVIFSMADLEIVKNYIYPIAFLLEEIANVTIISYWDTSYDIYNEIRKTNIKFLTLSDSGLESISRVERKKYLSICDNDIDFLKIRAHDIIINDYPISRDWIYLNSPSYQKLYGFAIKTENILKILNPDVAIIPHGSEPISKILIAKCKKLNIPFALMESPFIHDKILIDPIGMHFFPENNKIDIDWKIIKKRKLTIHEREKIMEFISDWKRSKSSKYNQHHEEINITNKKKILFIPGQIAYDANIINCRSIFNNTTSMAKYISKNISHDWIILYKPHPQNNLREEMKETNNLIITHGNIHDIFEICDVVLTISSNVGLEAIIYGKPVITCGTPYYSQKGFTIDMKSKEYLNTTLKEALNFTYNEDSRLNFLHYIIFEYLTDKSDRKALIAKIEESKRADHRWHPPYAPFTEDLINKDRRLEEWLQIGKKYNLLAEDNMYHIDIAICLSEKYKTKQEIKRKLEAEIHRQQGNVHERQIAKKIQAICIKHRLRYQFAKEFIEEEDIVLDIACGCGYGSKIISEKNPTLIIGIEADFKAIKYARKYFQSPQIKYIRGSINKLSDIEHRFSKIICFETIEHIENDKAFITSLINHLCDNGLLLLSSPNRKNNPLENHNYHIRHYTEEDLGNLLYYEVDKEINFITLYQDDYCIDKRDYRSKHLIFIICKDRETIDILSNKITAILPFQYRSIRSSFSQLFRSTAEYIHNNHPKLFYSIHPPYSKVKNIILKKMNKI